VNRPFGIGLIRPARITIDGRDPLLIHASAADDDEAWLKFEDPQGAGSAVARNHTSQRPTDGGVHRPADNFPEARPGRAGGSARHRRLTRPPGW